MKSFITILILVVVLGGGYYLLSGSSEPEGAMMEGEDNSMMMEDGDEPRDGSYTVIPEESEVGWSASKPLIPGYTHRGTFAVSAGDVTVADDTATGSFTLDMTALEVTSLGGGKEGRESQLEGHLKTGDFFNVEEYPTASFEITSVTRSETAGMYTVVGNLTIKDVTESVTFPAMIVEKDGKLHATANFAIDRTRWGITFGSASFFDDLADNAIGNEVTLSLKLVASNDSAMMEEEN